MKKKTIGIIAISVLCAFAIFAGAMFTHQYIDAKSSVEQFDELTDLIADVETEPETESTQESESTEEPELSEEELAAAQATLAHEKYGALFEQNEDFIGWIKIDGTKIDYPVMQSPNSPDYYLKHSFEKAYSDYGVPYIDEACATGISNNLIIYGHHMKNGTMFSDLCNYIDADFCKEHPIINFDTLSGFGEYQVVAVFKFNTNHEDFRYKMTMLEEFVKERNEALFSLDRNKIEAYMKKYGQPEVEEVPDDLFWASVYKAICGISNAPDELVSKALMWLHKNGYTVFA